MRGILIFYYVVVGKVRILLGSDAFLTYTIIKIIRVIYAVFSHKIEKEEKLCWLEKTKFCRFAYILRKKT